ncbi:Arrestin-like protein [Armadillidium nasatum]|uniref:Arrestin-like protein n=1 Tax=Armadillidium nasatum TaxID=96803 RepID=A0A5N5T2T1_9CRUS|nr:Arrestin-like protein [Armadillidium nasatum]
MVSAVKVFKKTAPNGKITVYLGRRDFIDNTLNTEAVDGVVLVDNDYLRTRKVFASVSITYRYGREEDEVMGLHFSKEMQLTCQQIFPSVGKEGPTEVQDRLIKKLGGNAYPFSIKPLGVIYELRVYVADNGEEKPHKRNSVNLAVRKVQYSPVERNKRQPSTLVSKGFTLSSGKLNLEVTLEREIYYHGEQHVEVTMTNGHFTREVASLESKEGCPITPGSNLHKTFTLTPLASVNRTRGGVALDGKLKDTDVNLASSTLLGVGKNPNDALGIVVSYSVRVRLNCGAIGGELIADLPFKLMHPAPAGITFKGREGENEDNIVFEDFARLRRGMSVDVQ